MRKFAAFVVLMSYCEHQEQKKWFGLNRQLSRPSGVVHYKLLPRIISITAGVYHQSLLASQKLAWKIMPHPPYSPDFAPLDFCPYRSLSNNLGGIFNVTLQNLFNELFIKENTNFISITVITNLFSLVLKIVLRISLNI